MNTEITILKRLLLLLIVLGLAGILGCQSSQQLGGTSHASVNIQGRSVGELQETTTSVFREAGYATGTITPEEMVFNRPGSRRDALKWGGLSGQGVTIRVKVKLTGVLDGSQNLQADAYVVQNSDDPFFQTESQMISLNRRPYQKLLNEVALRLK